jgi:hypothetical protein
MFFIRRELILSNSKLLQKKNLSKELVFMIFIKMSKNMFYLRDVITYIFLFIKARVYIL